MASGKHVRGLPSTQWSKRSPHASRGTTSSRQPVGHSIGDLDWGSSSQLDLQHASTGLPGETAFVNCGDIILGSGDIAIDEPARSRATVKAAGHS